MKITKTILLAAVPAACATAALLWFWLRGGTDGGNESGHRESVAEQASAGTPGHAPQPQPEPRRKPKPRHRPAAGDGAATDPQIQDQIEGDAGETPAEREERQNVESFYAAIEKWREPRAAEPTPQEMSEFCAAFDKIPEERKIDEIHHAINLIPDENLLLLAAILFDKSQNRDVIDAIYSDILNRDESVKMPVVEKIYQDREHPCWAEAAWLLDVTK